MIEKLRVKNFRCLRDVEVPLGPLNFFVGLNNTGKSSLLDAISVLSSCSSGRTVNQVFSELENPTRGLDNRGHGLLRNLTAADPLSLLEYECTVVAGHESQHQHKSRYTLSVGLASPTTSPAEARAFVRWEMIEISDGQGGAYVYDRVDPENPEYEVTDRSGKAQKNRLPSVAHTILGSLSTDPTLDLVRKSLRGASVYRLVPKRVAAPCKAWPGDRIEEDGFGLASYLAKLREDKPERYALIEGALREFVPGLQTVTFPNVTEQEKSILFHEEKGARFYASEASDGLLLFLAYLTLAYAHGDIGLLLVEEPETGVHPRRLKAIVEVLRAISRGALGAPPVQVVATSHSPYLLDWCSKDEVIFFSRDESGDVRVKPLAAVPDIDERIEDFESLGAWLYSVGEQACESHS